MKEDGCLGGLHSEQSVGLFASSSQHFTCYPLDPNGTGSRLGILVAAPAKLRCFGLSGQKTFSASACRAGKTESNGLMNDLLPDATLLKRFLLSVSVVYDSMIFAGWLGWSSKCSAAIQSSLLDVGNFIT